ncbi:GNAT family N-acetyltransferase [Enterococcus sp. BWM-S5]|uniref:GNAT family N-acetyltransferase n=1 Tax=Enterococcus larvae TaxID=2794352 RepID=A0ABS4CMD2_9ENTE|nr:GNAT family N-acetyltransferase [Enterococcus larvae]MBP1047744.1 GNAT family N-acetyltransferase [Enterococcus larvae]
MKTILFDKFTTNDFSDYYCLVSDERVMAQITERAIPEVEAKENYEKLLIRNQETIDFGSFRVLDNETNEFIGLAHLTPKGNDEAEIGYMFLPKYWRQGYGKVVVKELLRLAATSDFTVLTAMIDPENTASKRLLETNGFQTEFLGVMDELSTEILKKRLH